VALSSGFLSEGSLLFQARFNSNFWSGQLLAYGISEADSTRGQLTDKPLWDAGCMLTGGFCPSDTVRTSYTKQDWETGRNIITYSSGDGVPFSWDQLDASQQKWLRANNEYLDNGLDEDLLETEAVGEDRLKFLRGLNNGPEVDKMRERASILGDIINSNPVYVAAPGFNYSDGLEDPDKPYSGFVTAKQNRSPVLYVGANDGMLHAFDATNSAAGGTELLAYVPSEVYANLWELTKPEYGSEPPHRTFVDASPTAGDVFINTGAGDDWATVLVGGLGRGGQGFFALDITDPATDFDQAKAENIVLWEFTDSDDADIGFTYGQPAIVRMANGSWVAAVGNGYNSTDKRSDTDTHVSTTGNGVIFLIDIETGALLRKFDTGIGTADDPTTNVEDEKRPNGIRTVSPVDVNGDSIIDYIYAGDLFGNVWKLDVRSSVSNDWKFAFNDRELPAAETIAKKTPFFVARNAAGAYLPITSRVEVGLHPTSAGQLVYFGTGKYLEDGDNSAVDQDSQRFFAVWDRNKAQASRDAILSGHLEPQSIIEELPFSGDEDDEDDVRRTTSQTFAWHQVLSSVPAVNLSATDDPSDPGRMGWYMDLYSKEGGNTLNYGERMVADPVLRDGRIIFVTLLPLDNPCDFGGDGWLMELDARSGSRLDVSPFDLNGDGNFTLEGDGIPAGENAKEAVGGKRSKVGILPSPGILKDSGYKKDGKGREFKYFSGSSGDVEQVSESRSGAFIGRQSWRQINAE
jgi:type IV pilus assembly protein PilY1